MKETITKKSTIVAKSIKVIIIVGIIILGVKGMDIYQTHMEIKNYVEPYCAVKHQHNVDEYKACKVLKPTQVLQQLKETTNSLAELPEISLGM